MTVGLAAARPATPDDAEAITRTIALAFADDPAWGPALALPSGDTGHVIPFWRPFVDGALRFDLSTLIEGPSGEVAAVALWIAPGQPEMSEDAAAELEAFVASILDPAALELMLELWRRFDDNHPHEPQHAYLNLLATHPAHRGHGIAQGLLADALARFDAAGIPTYLESTNPANDHRYVRAGYARFGEFRTPHTDGAVRLMWREANAPHGPEHPRVATSIS